MLDATNLVVPWGTLLAPNAPTSGAWGRRLPFAVEAMPCIHLLQRWFDLSDPVTEEALHDTPMSSNGKRDPENHQVKKCKQWHFGMKAHSRVGADSGLLHTVIGTADNSKDVTQACALLVHGEETDVFADAGDQGVAKRIEMRYIKAHWYWAIRRSSAKPWARLRRWVR